jgi:site-specific recombinase XerD
MNTTDYSFLSCKEQFELLLKQCVNAHPRIRTLKTRREYGIPVRNFHRWWLKQGQPDITKYVFLNWMNEGVQKVKLATIESKVTVLNQFFTFLKERGFIDHNPLIELRKEYRTLGYRGILREMKRTGSISTVLEMADIPFSGTLSPGIIAYLDYLAALGKQCANHRCHLISFERFLRKSNVSAWVQVDRFRIENWVKERQPSSGYQQRCWLLVLDDLFQFLVNRGDVSSSPVPPPGKHYRRSLPPYIFSHDEIGAILEEASNLPKHRLMPLRGGTYKMLFLTLYTLGLRISEALNLRLGDIDFTQHCLTIGQTKFYKGRVLPFGPRFEATICKYMNIHPMLRNGERNTFIFPTDTGRTPRLVRDSAYRTLRKIVRKLGIVTPLETRPPNLHSFRHSFAVHRVEQWLRDGTNVDTKMPLLSAFLGHVDAAATQVYLTMTPQRLALIGDLFETKVGRRSKS